MTTTAPSSSASTFNGQRRPAPAPQPPVFQAPSLAKPTPMSMPRPRPVPRAALTVAAPTRPADTVVDGIAIHPRVIAIANDRGTSLNLVALAVLEPEATWTGKNGRSTVSLRGDLAAITADDSGEVIALAGRAKALRERTEPRDDAVKRGHGGSGAPMPNTIPDLLDRLRVRGFGIVRNGRHYIVRHHLHDGQVAFAKTPSDRHAIPNTVLDIRAEFGIDVREAA